MSKWLNLFADGYFSLCGGNESCVRHAVVAVWAVVLGAASTFAPAALAETPPAPAVPALPDATVIVAAALTAAEPVVTPTPELALPAPASAVSQVVTPVPPVPVPVPPTDPATAAPIQNAAGRSGRSNGSTARGGSQRGC